MVGQDWCERQELLSEEGGESGLAPFRRVTAQSLGTSTSSTSPTRALHSWLRGTTIDVSDRLGKRNMLGSLHMIFHALAGMMRLECCFPGKPSCHCSCTSRDVVLGLSLSGEAFMSLLMHFEGCLAFALSGEACMSLSMHLEGCCAWLVACM